MRTSRRRAAAPLGMLFVLGGGSLFLSVPVAAEDAARALLEEGRHQFAEGYFEAAEETLRRAAASATSEPVAAEVQLYLGLSLHAAGREAEAEEAFRRALRWDPTIDVDRERHKPAVVALFDRLRREEAAREPERGADVGAPPARSVIAPSARDRRPLPMPPRRRAMWAMLAATAATSVAGLALAMRGKADHRDWLDTVPNSSEADALERSGRAKLVAANSLFGVSLAAGITTLVLMVRRDRGSLEERGVSLAPLGLRARF